MMMASVPVVCQYPITSLPPRCERNGLAHLVVKEYPRRDSDFALMPIRLCPWLPCLTPQAHLLCAQPHDQIYSHQRSSSPTCLHRVWKENLCLPWGPQVEFTTIKPEERIPSLLLHVCCQGVPAVLWTLIIFINHFWTLSFTCLLM